jgi:predicted nucleic acid-binding Zn ribbon protein
MKRIIQPAGVMFIGSGFHINDYSSSGSGESVPAESKEAASSSDTASD